MPCWRGVRSFWYTGEDHEVFFAHELAVSVSKIKLAPVLEYAPTLSGIGYVGQIVTVGTGTWSGSHEISLQWQRDGAPIMGAEGDHYFPVAEDDTRELSCLVTATNATGSTTAETKSLRVTYAPPQVTGKLFDEIFDKDSGPQAVETARAFTGEALLFTLEGPDTEIDPRTGIVTVNTDTARDGDALMVVAHNSGGTARTALQVTVEGDESGDELSRTDLVTEATIDGVTFSFAEPRKVGHFISGGGAVTEDGYVGDLFVVGATTITGYTPGPENRDDRDMNGAVINPQSQREVGFDSRQGGGYDPDLNVGKHLPITLHPGESMMVAVSDPEAEEARDCVKHFVILTCLAEVPFADSFRPQFSAGDKIIHRLSDLDWSKLGTIAPEGRPHEWRDLEERLKRFVPDIVHNWNRDHMESPGHTALYGRDLLSREQPCVLKVNCDFPVLEKQTTVIGLIQRGIDRHGILMDRLDKTGGFPWGSDGGHHAGRKLAILFAGLLLDSPDMRDLSLIHNEGSENGTTGRALQEDAMTFYAEPIHHLVTTGRSETAWSPAAEDRTHAPYLEGMIGIPDWWGASAGDFSTSVSASWNGHPYRTHANHTFESGQVLAILAMDGMRELWNNPAYLDYHWRYLKILDGEADPYRFASSGAELYAQEDLHDGENAPTFEAWERGSGWWKDTARKRLEGLLTGPVKLVHHPVWWPEQEYREGRELRCSRGSWTGWPLPSYGHQWQREITDGGWQDIPGTEGINNQPSAYTPSQSDVGKRLRVQITARRGDEFETVHSEPTPVIDSA